MEADINFLVYVMFWTILAIMLVVVYSLRMVSQTQRYIVNMDKNIERLVKQTLRDEERILHDLEAQKPKRRTTTKNKSKK